MHNPHDLPSAGFVLSKIGWLAVVLAIIGGILGMHVIGGVHALEPASMAGTATATMHTAAPNHHGFSSALPSASPLATATMAAPAHQGDPFSCGGSSPDGQASMGGHDTCVPSFGPDLLVVPLPGILTWAHPRTAFTSIPGPKSKGRIPDPPSLTRLSIIRT